MVFCIRLEGRFSLGVSSVGWILGHEGSAFLLCVFERDADAGFQHPGVRV